MFSEIRLHYSRRQCGFPFHWWLRCTAHQPDGAGREITGLAVWELRSPYQVKSGSYGQTVSQMQAQGVSYENYREGTPGLSGAVSRI
jgi:hypothetical protein